MTEFHDTTAGEHLLLTSLGTNPKPACYVLEGRTAEAKLAPIALLDLLPEDERPNRVLALCTPEAKQDSWPLLEDALRGRCPVQLVEVPGGDRQEDVNDYLATVTDAIPGDVDLTVDVTHGFRHFSFLTYFAVLYLAALRGVRVRGAYYGMLNWDAPSPFLDLRPILELPRWVYALEVLRDTGSALSMAELLRDGSQNPPADIIADLSGLSRAYLSGLPLELGLQARKMRKHYKPLGRLLRDEQRLPLANELRKQLANIINAFALEKKVFGQGKKGKIALSEGELERQAHVIDDLLHHGHTATAIGLMNEWSVSWIIHLQRPRTHWLEYRQTRQHATRLLGAIRAVSMDAELCDVLTEEQRALGGFWATLSELRNGYNHHGMRRQELINDSKIDSQIERVLEYWKSTLRSLPDIPLTLGRSPGGPVLVSPIGLRPGVLFSAIHACKANGGGEPSLVLVICSIEAQDRIEEAIERAEYSRPVEHLLLDDAFGGKNEIKELAKKAREHFVGATEVLVNVTGGTTLMGFVAESLANEARSLACPVVRRFGLIDRRPPREQEIDPYQEGEPFWLDPKDNGRRWQS